MSAQGLTTSESDSKSKAALTTALAKGAASSQTQTLILENVPDRRESLTEDKTSSARVVQTKKLAKSQAVVSSHHMGVNNSTIFLSFINTLQYTNITMVSFCNTIYKYTNKPSHDVVTLGFKLCLHTVDLTISINKSKLFLFHN